MANVIKKTTNRFTKGLIMDFSPENTKNEVLSNALNATLLTFNGNELSLQNDMGNARVETAYLPEGYMPVGTCEYGGIIYIVSYNPLEDKSQIGCFPSPERNISSDELGQNTEPLMYLLFLKIIEEENKNAIITGELVLTSYSVLLKLDNLNPGDKFVITSGDTIYNEAIKDMYINDTIKENPIIALNIVSIEDSGKIIYLNSDVRLYETTINDKTYKYKILGSSKNGSSNIKEDIDSYRNAISSGYSVFKSKTSGKLAILAELIMIDSYSVTHSIKAKPESDTEFDIIIHTDVSPKLNSENYLYEPKLKYYYLSKSQGYMQTVDDEGKGVKFPLFDNDNSISYFYNIKLKDIYSSNNSQLFNVTLKDVSEFKFPKSKTYHGRLISFNGNNYSGNDDIYTKFFENKYHKINVDLIKDNSGYFYNTLQATVYEYEPGGSGEEIPYTNPVLNELYTYYIKTSNSEYVDVERNTDYKTEVLYEIVATPTIATEAIIKDKSIEKFLYQQIYYFKKATLEDLASSKILYYKEVKDDKTSYSQLIGEYDENVEYYVYEPENTLVSIGYEVTVVNSLNIYYYTGTKNYYAVSDDKKNVYYDFDRYPKVEDSPLLGAPFNLYRIVENESFREVTEEELLLYKNDSTSIALYYIENYKKVSQSDVDYDSRLKNSILFIVFPRDEIITKNYFIPSQEFNYIKGTTPTDTYPKNDPIEVLTIADFIPELDSKNSDKYNYNDVKLASIKIPNVVIENGLDLPFKYDYTIVPCMNYGRLDHLAVSNTIDFGKLHAFNQSGFHTWKYYVENGLLRLTFGADIYDTYEELKVDGIILEFYDLWGYAGTLEITDKKSYSGVFTKIIPLNTINALSNKKIIKEDNNLKYSNLEYVRNIEITNNDSDFKYKDFIIEHDDITGWKSLDTSKIIDNDCGTLYSNLIYGVKAYFRRKINDNYEFIPKKDFFLYTLPIFNEYYSSLQNFDTIENPELLFTLTYKLLDNSTKTPLNSEEFINGYNPNDYEKINTYLNGNYSNNTLEIIKYYKYTGVSKLYLEVGLNESYKNLNLFNNKDINNHYKCNLLLVSNNNESFDIKLENSEITDGNSILNYTENFKNNNYLKFVTDEGLSNIIKLSNISKYNFISNSDSIALNIEYSFDVGYKAIISNITTIQIPATTVCALFHRKLDGEYNYGDFGIYPRIINDKTELYSETMIYTAGDITTSILGVCKLISTEGNLYEQCSSLDDWYESPTKEIKKLFLLHTGNNLKDINKHLKKLAFYLPHVHGFIINNKEYYPNLSYGKNEFNINTDVLLIPIGKDLTVGGHGDDAYGNYPMNHYKQAPKFNFIANTLDSLEQYSEFISAIDYVGDSEGAIWKVDYDNGYIGATGWSEPITLRIFEGFTGTLLLSFNQKLLKTMSSIYAYNPDYNLLDINTGKINLLDYSPIFNSNLVNTHSEFKDDIVLNDYILLGRVKISDYLSYLTQHSGIATKTKNTKLKNTETEDTEIFLNLVNFTANFENCGTNTNPVLLSSLTYKAPIPEEMMNDLVFDNSQRTILKHSNGSVLLLNGIPNKKTLYGYDSVYNKLVTLDVSNYIILEDGTLELNYLKTENKNDKYYKNEDVQINESWLNGYQFMNTEMSGTIILNKVNPPSYLKCFEDKVYLILMFNPRDSYKYFDISFTLKSNTHKLTLSNIEFKNKYTIIPASYNNLTISTLDLYNLEDKLILSSLINKEQVTINNNFVVNSYINKQITIERVNNTNFYRINKPDLWNLGNDLAICLIELNINRLSIMYDKYIIPDNIFIDTIKTIEYSTIKNHKYIINEKYNDARFRGTSVTINDLVYKPNINEHRLYMKNGLYQYDNYLENKIAYRDAGWGVADGCKGYQNYNDLFMATGPCFTLDNL